MSGGLDRATPALLRPWAGFTPAHNFYLVLVPAALVLFNAAVRWSINYDLTLPQLLAISVALNTVPWWACLTVMWALHRLVRPGRLPLWSLATLSTLITGILLHGYIRFVVAEIAMRVPAFMLAKAAVPYGLTLPYVVLFLKCALPVIFTVLACLEIGERLLGFGWWNPRQPSLPCARSLPCADAPVAAPEPASMSAPAAPAPPATARFLRHSKLPATATILALDAQDHYLRIYADCGSDLIRYRFTDALTDMTGARGLRVHRSWRVNSDYAAHFTAAGKMAQIGLHNGLIVPVSVRYRSAVALELAGR